MHQKTHTHTHTHTHPHVPECKTSPEGWKTWIGDGYFQRVFIQDTQCVFYVINLSNLTK